MTEHRLSLTALAESLKDGSHSIFSASGSHLWMHCAGGLLANLLAPDETTYEAAEGTVAHGIGELWLRTGRKPTHLVGTVQTVEQGKDKYDITITTEMLNDVREYVDWCSWLPGKHFIETKVYYSDLTPIPNQGGTADHVACSYQRGVITDLKFGKGKYVEVKNNSQALLYALGFFYEWDWLYDFQEIEIRIAQPRKDNMSTWTVTREELLAFADEVKIKAHAAWSYDAPRTPGTTQCSFCRVKATCTAHVAWQEQCVTDVFATLDDVTAADAEAFKERLDLDRLGEHLDVHRLSTEHLAKLYGMRSMFESWWASVHNELNIRAARGENIPTRKLVEGRARRKIKDEKKTLFMLNFDYGIEANELVEKKFLSPAQIEKVLLKHGIRRREIQSVLEPLVYKPPGKLTLVSDSDPRPAVVDISEDAFAQLDLQPLNPETEEE